MQLYHVRVLLSASIKGKKSMATILSPLLSHDWNSNQQMYFPCLERYLWSVIMQKGYTCIPDHSVLEKGETSVSGKHE